MTRVVAAGASTPAAVRVAPHLRYVVGDASVNPREVKRYINTYTLVTRVNSGLAVGAVLALQTIDFCDDWRRERATRCSPTATCSSMRYVFG